MPVYVALSFVAIMVNDGSVLTGLGVQQIMIMWYIIQQS